MSPLRDKLFVISLILLTALAIAAVPRIYAAAPVNAGSSTTSEAPAVGDP